MRARALAASIVVAKPRSLPAAAAKRVLVAERLALVADREVRDESTGRRARRRPCRWSPRRRVSSASRGLAAERRAGARRSAAPAPCCSACRGSPGAATSSTSTPQASAAPCAQRSTMARTRASSAVSRARTENSHAASSGMMFTACPPLVTKPCTRTPSRKCTRCESMRRNVSRQAVSALLPSHGASRGVRRRAREASSAIHALASAGCASMSRSKGWNIIAASTPSKTPASSS